MSTYQLSRGPYKILRGNQQIDKGGDFLKKLWCLVIERG